MIRIDVYLYALIFIVIAGAVLGLFRESIFNRLSTRIVVLILASGPITFILFPIASRVLIHVGVVGAPNSFTALALYVLVTLGTPLVLGLLGAHFVRRPLRHFKEAMASLEQSNYTIQLRPTGIREFDEVFTKFNKLTERLQHEEKLRKDLVSDTSHELNTPLTTIIGQLTALQEGKYPLTKERITTLKEQAERLAELVRQLDAYTKARMPDAAKPEDIPLKPLCVELIGHFELELKQKGITAQLHIADGVIIRANRSALQQILANLMQNTLRYSHATEVTITSTAGKLVFSDNGKGVPAESLPYLFERFYRVDRSRSRTSGGMGLGLAIVRELAESQGWDISARAGHPGLLFVVALNV
jgi:two-component system sensor histidine kinase BaeS